MTSNDELLPVTAASADAEEEEEEDDWMAMHLYEQQHEEQWAPRPAGVASRCPADDERDFFREDWHHAQMSPTGGAPSVDVVVQASPHGGVKQQATQRRGQAQVAKPHKASPRVLPPDSPYFKLTADRAALLKVATPADTALLLHCS